MARLRIARTDDVKEPEDHIAALCEMMAGLITGSFGAPADLAEQRHFFDTHIGCWAPRFFEDLQAAQSAVLYMPVGTIGRLFLAVEAEAFDMAAYSHRSFPDRRSTNRRATDGTSGVDVKRRGIGSDRCDGQWHHAKRRGGRGHKQRKQQ